MDPKTFSKEKIVQDVWDILESIMMFKNPLQRIGKLVEQERSGPEPELEIKIRKELTLPIYP